jgi:hypothetical protein
MARWLRVLILIVIGIGALVSFREVFMGHKNQVSAETLEGSVRAELPIGSSLSTVEGFLQQRGIEFSFQASDKTVYAVVRKVKGSTFIIRQDMTFKFNFDDSSKLMSIDAKAIYTGP